MNTPKSVLKRAMSLISALLDDHLPQEQQQELERLMLEHPAVRSLYAAMLEQHAMLEWKLRGSSSRDDMEAGNLFLTEHMLEYVLDKQADALSDDSDINAVPYESMDARHDSYRLQHPQGEPTVAVRHIVIPKPVYYVSLAALAAMLVFAIGLSWHRMSGADNTGVMPSPQVAQVVGSVDAFWAGNALPDNEGWLPVQTVHLTRGQVQLQFASGAMVMLRAPAEFQAMSANEARLSRGSLAARVNRGGDAMHIHTPTATIIDRGTAFGVSVASTGEMSVAVFDGVVDVMVGRDPQVGASVSPPQRRLNAGDALVVSEDHGIRRLVTVTDDLFPALPGPLIRGSSRSALITSVSDNLDDEDNFRFYRVVPNGFGEDVRAYVDRNHEWNGVDASGMPTFLLGADYIMTFNDDKERDVEITVTLSQPAAVFVLFDDRVEPPAWLVESFVNTGLKIGMDEDEGRGRGLPEDAVPQLGVGPGVSIDAVFSIWKHTIDAPGIIVLGPRGGGLESGGSMYGVVATPLKTGQDL